MAVKKHARHKVEHGTQEASKNTRSKKEASEYLMKSKAGKKSDRWHMRRHVISALTEKQDQS